LLQGERNTLNYVFPQHIYSLVNIVFSRYYALRLVQYLIHMPPSNLRSSILKVPQWAGSGGARSSID